MHESSSSALFGALQRAQALAANPRGHIKLNPMGLSRTDMDAVKAVSSSLFDAEPKVLRLMHQINERKAQVPGEIQQWLEVELASINAEIVNSEKALARAVFLDAKGNDKDFAKTDEAIRHIAYLKSLTTAISGAKDSLEPLPHEAIKGDMQLLALQKELFDWLWILKVQHLENLRNQEIDRRNAQALEAVNYE